MGITTNWTERCGNDLMLMEVCITEDDGSSILLYEVYCKQCDELSTGLAFSEAELEIATHEHRSEAP